VRSYSLRIPFVFSWYFARVLRWCHPRRHGGSAEPVVGFDSNGLAVIWTKSRVPIVFPFGLEPAWNSLRDSGAAQPRFRALPAIAVTLVR